MKKIKQMAAGFLLVFGMSLAVLPAAPVYAIDVFDQCDANSGSDVCKAADDDSASKMIKTVVSILIFLLGAIAVIMIIVGGIRYTTSGGDASATKSARETILYSVVGLVVAIMAYAIVNFVLGRL